MKVLFLLMVMVLASNAYAANIQGTVYDSSLDKVVNAIVEINTKPMQRMVAEKGFYNFNVPIGNYTLTAKHLQNNNLLELTEEKITVIDNGDYNIDLFLFPNLEDEDLTNETSALVDDVSFYEVLDNKPYLAYSIMVITLLMVALIVYLKYKPGKKTEVLTGKENGEEKEDLQKVIEIIKNSDGRITQKDLRKHIPLSEAKISLMITELEAKGKIQKIKKGRGNILILK